MKNKMKATKMRIRKEKNFAHLNGIEQKDFADSQEFVAGSMLDLSDEDQRSDDQSTGKKMKRKKESWQIDQPESRRGRKNIFIEKKRTSISNGISSQTETKRKRKRNEESFQSGERLDESMDKSSDIADDEDPNSEFLPSRSGRKKRARKIFDPADHIPAARNCKKSRGGSPESLTEETKADRRMP